MNDTPSSPYPGLRPFERHEIDLFFGRETHTDQLLMLLGEHHFLAVVGPSGCGKSSLVRTGLLAGLEMGFLRQAGARWRMAEMRPGTSPFERLTDALLADAAVGPKYLRQVTASATTPAALPRDLLRQQLARGPRSLHELLQDTPLPPQTRLLLLVDQFEEVFRYDQHGAINETMAFVSLLLTSSQHPDIYVVLTMRSDFLGDCALFYGLPEAINRGLFLTPRLTREQLQEAIEEPARVFGGEIDPALSNRLLNDAGHNSDQLPLVQHALQRMWDLARAETAPTAVEQGVCLTLEHYGRIGGLQTALSQHADEAYEELTPTQQRLAAVLFRSLGERGSDQRDTRRPVRLAEVAALAQVDWKELVAVVDVFRQRGRNFLTPPAGRVLEPDSVIDISHESLLRQWERLKAWVDQEAQWAAVYRRLEDSARRWEAGHAALWRTPELDEALVWRQDAAPSPQWAQRYGTHFDLSMRFLDASRAQQHEEQRQAVAAQQRELRHARRFIGVVLCAFLMATTLAVWGWLERNRAGIMHKTAEEARQQAVFEGEKAKLFSEQAEARKLQELRARARLLGESARKEIGQGNTTNAILLALEILSEQDENIDHNALAPVRLALYSALLEHREWRLLKPKTVVPYATFYPASHPARLQLLTFGKNTIQHWEVTDQHETATLALPGHRGQVRSAAFRSDGQRLVTAAEDKTARLWERDGKLLKELPHPAAVTRAAFHPDGQGLLTAAAKTVYLWDEHGALQKELPHLEAVIAATFRADGQGLLTATAKTIYWWDASGALLQQRDFPAPVQYAAMSVNGQQVVAVTDDSWVRIWDTVSNQEIFLGGGERPAHFRPVRQAAFSPDGRYVVTASDDGTSRLWLANDGRFFASLAGHDRAVLHAEFSPDSTRVVTTSEDGTVRLWTVHGQAPTTVLSGHSEAVRQVEFSTDGTRLLTASEDNTARLWEVPQGQELQRFAGHQQGVELVRLSPDGRRLVTVDAMRTTRLWDSQSGMLIAVLVEPAPAELVGQDTGDVDVAFSPDSRLVATASNDTTVHLWNAANGKRLPGFAGHIDKVHAVSFSPADGRYLVTASDDNSARLWDVARRQALVVLPHEKPVQYAVFSPSGEQLITVAPGMPVAVWHMPELQAERHAEPLSLPCPGHQKEVSHAAVNRAGSHLITTADDGTVCLFENEQGTFHLRRSFFHRMLGGRGFWWWRSPRGRSTRREIPGIKHATFSPDGQRLLTASKDGTIRLWDTATGRPLVLLSGHDAAFHPDGQQIAIAALNHQVLLWTPFASTAELLRYACNVVPRQLTEEQREEFGLSRHNDVDDDTGLQDAATAPSGYDCATLGSRRD